MPDVQNFFHKAIAAHSKKRNVVVTKSVLLQLNVVHKDATAQMLLTITFKIYYIVPGNDTVLLGI